MPTLAGDHQVDQYKVGGFSNNNNYQQTIDESQQQQGNSITLSTTSKIANYFMNSGGNNNNYNTKPSAQFSSQPPTLPISFGNGASGDSEEKEVVVGDIAASTASSQQQLIGRLSSMSLLSPSLVPGPSNAAPPGSIESTAGISSAMAIQHRAHKLVDSELSEILDYPTVYYFGENRDLKVRIDLNKPNRGYDDDRGDYRVNMGDHLAFRYELIENIGKGSFGQVFKSKDHKKGVIVAVKVIRNKKRFQQQARIEIKILNKLKAAEGGVRNHCIQICETFDFRKHTCLVFPLYGLNLYEYLKIKGFRGCSLPFVKQVAIQLLETLAFLRRLNIIHCDLKPENILLKDERRAQIVVIDFGSSCFVKETVYTYIQSRFYRSPEVILGFEYGESMSCFVAVCFSQLT